MMVDYSSDLVTSLVIQKQTTPADCAPFLYAWGEYIQEEDINAFAKPNSNAVIILRNMKFKLQEIIKLANRFGLSEEAIKSLRRPYTLCAKLIDYIDKMGTQPLPEDFFDGIYDLGPLLMTASIMIKRPIT